MRVCAGVVILILEFFLKFLRLIVSPLGRRIGSNWCETSLEVNDLSQDQNNVQDSRMSNPNPPSPESECDQDACTPQASDKSHNWDPFGSPNS